MKSSTYFDRRVAAVHYKVAASQEEQVLLLTILVLSWPWEDGRIWAHKISWKSLTTWRPFCLLFPEPTVLHSQSPPWTPCRGCWRSKTAVASDFILVVLHDERQFLVANYKALSGTFILCIMHFCMVLIFIGRIHNLFFPQFYWNIATTLY